MAVLPPYGYCPHCGKAGTSVLPSGIFSCPDGHQYASNEAVVSRDRGPRETAPQRFPERPPDNEGATVPDGAPPFRVKPLMAPEDLDTPRRLAARSAQARALAPHQDIPPPIPTPSGGPLSFVEYARQVEERTTLMEKRFRELRDTFWDLVEEMNSFLGEHRLKTPQEEEKTPQNEPETSQKRPDDTDSL